MASSSRNEGERAGVCVAAANLDLEDFSLSGLAAQLSAMEHQPGFAFIRERIRQEGFEAGKSEERERSERERKELAAGPVMRIESLLTSLADERRQFMQFNTEELLQLALALTRRVLRVEAPRNPDLLKEKLKVCLQQLELKSSYVIRVNPDQVEALDTLLAMSGLPLFGETPYRIIGDRRVPAGSLVLEGDSARLESICEDELNRLEQHLLKLHSEQKGSDAD